MEYTDFMVWKAVGLVCLYFVVNLFYTAITGQTIEQARRDISKAKENQPKNPTDL